MLRVVDTNVAVIANGRGTNAHPSCQLKAIKALREVLTSHTVVIDIAGEMLSEYRRYCDPKGQPGVGDRFFREIIMNYSTRIRRIDLPKTSKGDFVDFPNDPRLSGFDWSDRKFAAASRQQSAPVLNATDSDWLIHRRTLKQHGIDVLFLCGCDKSSWFIRSSHGGS